MALLMAAKKLGRPVHWMSGRSEAFLSDNQARDIYSEVELALDDKGRFLALRIRNTGNLGAYVGAVGANIPTLSFTRCLPGMYDIRHIDISARCAFTNTIADRALSRRRPAGSELRARARGRGGRARHRHRSGQAAAAQSHSRRRPCRTRPQVGTAYRLRRFRADPRQGAGACRLRWLQRAPPRGAKARQISRHRHFAACSNMPAARRSKAPCSTFPGDGTLQLRSQCTVDRAGPRLGISAAGRRTARHCAGEESPTGTAIPRWRCRATLRSARVRRMTVGASDRQMRST